MTAEPVQLGGMRTPDWIEDPKRLGFTLARYKFVAKMLTGRQHVLEIGCGDGFATRIVAQHVHTITAIDNHPNLIDDAQRLDPGGHHIRWLHHDIMQGPPGGGYNAVYALDVLEHVPRAYEDTFMWNIIRSLAPHAAAIFGMPSLESQPYASPNSIREHVNCKTEQELRNTMQRWFHNVFIFSMNDETLHTGYGPMSHYRIALCTERKQQ